MVGVNTTIPELETLTTPVLVAVGLIAVIQAALMIWALVRLYRDKRTRISDIPRTLWVPIILCGGIIGSVVFLVLHSKERRQRAVQRHYEQTHHPKSVADSKETSTVIDNLYGK
ncbi:PLDc N-terminal domain-containing protein [Corynebacterium sp. TAE3-ERU12]|uniref:PLDc N-terminal domain-containing protein n=1 Tax=Corynebacterium sp. TAE3-ERU12 TaxID=2849491 RepID=UPI001C45BE88|nr:PLDc N-terminal domain-containing protein [Corynebacterium sp. TAE3-ERU12]MBV7294959.1 PLDc N-terminal domain-containing protein [Corynebacterium sp. TAE3-ERU12]